MVCQSFFFVLDYFSGICNLFNVWLDIKCEYYYLIESNFDQSTMTFNKLCHSFIVLILIILNLVPSCALRLLSTQP
ncbi:Hypothetical protein EIN_421040, partial [Entamoeba invadens IP1]